MAPPSSVTVLFLVAVLTRLRPTLSSSPAAREPTLTFCSGRSPYFSSSPAVTSGEFADFLDAVCSGTSSFSNKSYAMSSYVAQNRTMYGVAQCRPDAPASACAACLGASSRYIAATACAAAAIWYDVCFLRYSDEDPSRFREDEHTATVFNASRRALSDADGKAAVTGLLAALGRSMTSSSICSSIGAGATAAAGGGLIYGLARCAAGISCPDCSRCLRGALEVAEREYNGSAGMQVLRLSCMARYESHPFYNATSLRQQGVDVTFNGLNASIGLPNGHAFPPAAHPAPAPRRSPVLPAPASPPPPPAQMGVATQQGHGMRWTRKRLVIVIAPIATGAVIVAAILLLVWFRRKQPAGTRHAEDFMQGENMYYQAQEHISADEEEEMSCQFYSYQVLEAATCHFSNSNKLGSGGFGTVYKGTLGNGKQVAVKRLKDSKRNLQELEREISIVANLRHKNLLSFLGHCFQEEMRLLVYEYVPNNSLEKFWYRASFDQSQRLGWATWFNIIMGVARGLRYLHDQGIIHRDLKPHNVLLDENFIPKIADFDLMRVYDKEKTHESTEKIAGTFGYMAPECTSGRRFQLSTKSDVYRYGVLVLEIITGHKIYTFEGQNSEGLVEYVWQHWTGKKASDVVDGYLGVEGRGQEQALRCVHVALLCVQSERSRRPTMGQAIAMLMSGEEMELQEPSLPGYVVHTKAAAPGVLRYLPCLT